MPSSSSSSRRDDRREEKEEEEDSSSLSWYSRWRHRIEYFLFLILGGFLWRYAALKILDKHRFPYHLYPVEVIFIIWGPIILLGLLLGILDRTVKAKED